MIQGIAPGAIVIDIAHGLAPGGLAPPGPRLQALSYCPGVLLAVVDPGVGAEPRHWFCAVGDRLLVGPTTPTVAGGGCLGSVDQHLGDVMMIRVDA